MSTSGSSTTARQSVVKRSMPRPCAIAWPRSRSRAARATTRTGRPERCHVPDGLDRMHVGSRDPTGPEDADAQARRSCVADGDRPSLAHRPVGRQGDPQSGQGLCAHRPAPACRRRSSGRTRGAPPRRRGRSAAAPAPQPPVPAAVRAHASPRAVSAADARWRSCRARRRSPSGRPRSVELRASRTDPVAATRIPEADDGTVDVADGGQVGIGDRPIPRHGPRPPRRPSASGRDRTRGCPCRRGSRR